VEELREVGGPNAECCSEVAEDGSGMQFSSIGDFEHGGVLDRQAI
jgi:hypothetical protein